MYPGETGGLMIPASAENSDDDVESGSTARPLGSDWCGRESCRAMEVTLIGSIKYGHAC